MEAIIQKWGNSNAIRIPKMVLTTVGIKENDRVEIIINDNGFTVRKSNVHKTLADRLESFYDKPVKEIERIETEEYDWGKPAGGEVW